MSLSTHRQNAGRIPTAKLYPPAASYRIRFARHKMRARRFDAGFSIVLATINRRKFLIKAGRA